MTIAGVAWYGYARSYQPWIERELGAGIGEHVEGLTDGVHETGLIDVASASEVAAYPISLRMGGRHRVTITGADEILGSARVSIAWQVLAGRLAPSLHDATTRHVSVRHNEFLTVWLLLRHRSCSPSETAAIESVRIHWSALGVAHLYTAHIHTSGTTRTSPLYICYPASARDHLMHS